MLLQFPVGSDRLLRGLLGLQRGRLQGLDARIEALEILGPVVHLVEPAGDAVEPGRHGGRQLHGLLHRLSERRELGAARREGGEHRADRTALFTRTGDEQFELAGLFVDRLALVAGHVLEGI